MEQELLILRRRVLIDQSLVSCVVLLRLLFVFFVLSHLAIALSVLSFTGSDYYLGIYSL
jgi:hypothetical protein